MQQGRIKFYDAAKGFGFIKPDDGEAEVYISKAEAEKTGDVSLLKRNQRVAFDVKSHRVIGGLVAVRIEVIEEERFRTTALSDMDWPDSA